MANERMTPTEFKAEYRRKGWTGRMLAERWQKSVAWISKIGNDPDREAHWDDAVRGLPDEKLNYGAIFSLPEVEAWFNMNSGDQHLREDDMSDFVALLEDFNKAVFTEARLVERVSIELLHYFGLADGYSWLAVKDQIDRAAMKAGVGSGHIALQWIKAAQDQRLSAAIDQYRTLVITEKR